MKTQRLVTLLLAGALLAGAASSLLAQAERVKVKAKELKKQVESPSNAKTNTPARTNAPAKPK
ncbi:MAG: hypothetical protein HZA90_21080 [Verrucomicrobia bacterium]|nr:hypothetical protein [Verrucomicrobiota bacterium]